MILLLALRQSLQAQANPQRALISQRFFKTGVGQYGAGDQFLGLTVPICRLIARSFTNLTLPEIAQLLATDIHEERLIALLILVELYQRADVTAKQQVFTFYLEQLLRINNWDLVDLSAPQIIGHYLLKHAHDQAPLLTLARSPNFWAQRVSMVATLTFIRAGSYTETFMIAEILLGSREDLIHKAIGWMLREVGKRDQQALEDFLQQHYAQLPRTTLRYAIERFPEPKRLAYLQGLF